jgi:hypothetical protein
MVEKQQRKANQGILSLKINLIFEEKLAHAFI